MDILVVILSAALAVFLILAVVATALIIKLLQSVKRITAKAEHIIDNVEHVGETFRNAAGPLALFRVISNIVESVSKHNKRK